MRFHLTTQKALEKKKFFHLKVLFVFVNKYINKFTEKSFVQIDLQNLVRVMR